MKSDWRLSGVCEMVKGLEDAVKDLNEGREPRAVTVRQLLDWFGAQRRGYNIVQMIRGHLEDAGVTTEPDFESTWIDGEIKLGFGSFDKGDKESSDSEDCETSAF